MPDTCSCGSARTPRAEKDARGIFLTYACDRCRKQKLAGFRADVLADPNYWHDEPVEDC